MYLYRYRNKLAKNLLLLCLGLLFVVFSYCYYQFFIVSCDTKEICGQFINYANLHDSGVYQSYLALFNDGTWVVAFDNNLGISFFYYLLTKIFNLDINVISYIVNVAAIILYFLVNAKLLYCLKIDPIYAVVILLNPALFYFTLLLNKDAMSLLFTAAFIYSALGRHVIAFGFLLVMSAFIRLQLPLFGCVLYFLLTSTSRNVMGRLFFCYFASVAASVILEKVHPIIEYDTMESSLGLGLSVYIRSLNDNYFIGSLLLNPLRVFQYFYDFIRSVFMLKIDGLWDVSKIKDIPQVLFMGLSFIGFILGFNKKLFSREVSALLIIVYSFFVVWLINPTINYRYFMLVIPYFNIAGLLVLRRWYRNFRLIGSVKH